MQIGRFFSLQQGRVGQLLSPRVLVVRYPFRRQTETSEPVEFCCFGFDSFRQAQKFLQSLAHLRLSFQLRQSQLLANCPYEVVLPGGTDLARTLAYWDRRDRQQVTAISPSAPMRPIVQPAEESIAA